MFDVSSYVEYQLSEVINFVADKIDASKIGVNKYISTDNMLPNRGGIKIASKLPESSKFNAFKQSDTLFSNIRTYFRKVWLAEFSGGASPDVLIFRTKDEEILDPIYLYYLLTNEDFVNYTVLTAKGAKMPRGDKAAIMLYKVSLPPIEEQRKLAQGLCAIDKKIALNRQINQTLEQIAQAIFKSWFVDFEPVKAKIAAKQNGQDPERAAMRAISDKTDEQLDQLDFDQRQQLAATAALFPDELVDSELGEIPKGWEMKKVADIVRRFQAGKRYTKKQVESFGKVPVFEQGNDIVLGYHNEQPGLIASPEEPLFIFGDHTCVTHLSCEPFDISQNVIPLAGNEYPTMWVYYAVKDKQTFQEYRRHWSEFVIKDVITPDPILAEKYSELVTMLHKRKERSVSQNNVLIQIRDLLLPKLLSGEITLSDAQFATGTA